MESLFLVEWSWRAFLDQRVYGLNPLKTGQMCLLEARLRRPDRKVGKKFLEKKKKKIALFNIFK